MASAASRLVRISPVALLLMGATAPRPNAAIELTPIVEDGSVSAIEVAMTLDGGPSQDFAFTAPIVYPGAPGVAERMTRLSIVDARGPLPMAIRDDSPIPGGFPYFRHWRASRATTYPVTIRYRAAVMAPGGIGGPAYGLRAVGGGVVGAGPGLLIVPDADPYARTALRWNLSHLPAGAIASTSLGDGTTLTYAGGPTRLQRSWLLAGPAHRYPAKGVANGFSATWLGQAPFDATRAMAQTARAHAWLARYFPNLRPTPPYRVFMQFREAPPFGGGTALEQSFMLSRGPLRPGEAPVAPLSTLFHEMIHQWTGSIEAPQGEASWFSEGLTTYYEKLLPMTSGFASVSDHGRAINGLAEAYFTSKARNWSAAQITKVGFADEEVRHTPYVRSAMYFFDLDARIRAKSAGRRTLNSIMFPLFLARERGERFDTARWEAIVSRELGPEEAERFRRLILAGGDTLDPRPDAFGPCFDREAATFEHEGRTIAGYRWVRVARVPDAACRRR